ncbi:MAG: translation initiation factor IF-3 [Meiothermus sp.]|uniref:translation initiation factor IF-3 n=1 Tax=Meiothermus sp. TaxID=1955249 RepID=UPI0025FA5D1E|nr:translation initiation factor IF-3 [Meiothermus sp.]MCS7057746.1 translation initiation factor IF-3 [Meiothermus sp.]MCX7740027.1 translation initiation factor IF-3 [Meiothermus sp.]MDW8482324.1 translation initiation factor IF-3 [Meiothermus sp.]
MKDVPVNERIRVRQVRLIDENGVQIGVVDTREALRLAQEREYDLVLVSPNSVPPVARLLDYGKWRYEQQQAEKEARKKAKRTELKSMKLRPKIEAHDYNTKLSHIRRFLEEGHKVKVTIMFRGRELAHQELGYRLLERIAKDLEGVGFVEMRPELMGRDMNMVMAPGSKPSAPITPASPAGSPS